MLRDHPGAACPPQVGFDLLICRCTAPRRRSGPKSVLAPGVLLLGTRSPRRPQRGRLDRLPAMRTGGGEMDRRRDPRVGERAHSSTQPTEWLSSAIEQRGLRTTLCMIVGAASDQPGGMPDCPDECRRADMKRRPPRDCHRVRRGASRESVPAHGARSEPRLQLEKVFNCPGPRLRSVLRSPAYRMKQYTPGSTSNRRFARAPGGSENRLSSPLAPAVR